MVNKYLGDKSGIALAQVRRLAAELKIVGWDEATRSDVRWCHDGATGGERDSEQEQDEVDQEQDGNVFWATAKAMESQRPDKVSIHISAASGLGKLACNMVATAACVPLGSATPNFGRTCARCVAVRDDLKVIA